MEIIQIELGLILLVLTWHVVKDAPVMAHFTPLRRRAPMPLLTPLDPPPLTPPARGPAPVPAVAPDAVVILKDGKRYCERDAQSHDIQEFLDTPGFFIQHPDGRIEAGKQ